MMNETSLPCNDVTAQRRALVAMHHERGGDSVRLWNDLKRYNKEPIKAYKYSPKQKQLPSLQRNVSFNPFQCLRRAQAQAVMWREEQYPPLLARHENPPPIVYMRGAILEEDNCAVAIVGSRRATRAARQLAFDMARDLAARGVTIISGLATGVDAAAHEGALEAGRTIAVIGNGIDTVYPAKHNMLAERISKQGAILSQFPCGTPPKPYHFPIRNDTIVRMALGVVVVEAPQRSGSLITADIALQRNVELMACPGSAGRPYCAGNNGLIKEKAAAVVESADDVLRTLRLENDVLQRPRIPPAVWDQIDGQPVDWLTHEPASIEELSDRSGRPIGLLRAQLTELELDGHVIRVEGDRYRLR